MFEAVNHVSAPTLAFIGGIGVPEMIILGVVGVLLFGKRLPEVGRSVGKTMTEFKRGLSGIESDIDTASTRPATRTYDEADFEDTEERLESSAPKFQPPTSEPQTESANATS